MQIVFRFLELLHLSFNRHTVSNFLSTHSNHPSLLSISDLFDEYKIDNAAVRINKDHFSQIPTPFIAKTQSIEGDYCLITKIEANKIFYETENGKKRTESFDQFFLQYSGVVLVAETNEGSGEPNYLFNKKKYRTKQLAIGSISLVAVLISAYYLVLSGQPLSLFSVFIVKLTGLIVTILLLPKTFEMGGDLINKFCSTASGNGCDNILNSPAARIFNGKLSWSEVGFFYFAITFLMLVVNPVASSVLLLAALNILCLPYTVYSIWHQYKVAKQWCRLCVTIQALLWVEFFCFLVIAKWQLNGFNQVISPVLILAGITALIFLGWYLLKPLLKNIPLVNKLQRDTNQFKKDESIFYTLLKQQRSVNNFPHKGEIIFGNPLSKFEVTFVSNPYCYPCAEMNKKLKTFLVQDNENIKLKIVYTVSAKKDDPKNKIIASFISMYKKHGAAAAKAAMDEWYEEGIKKPAVWLSKHGIEQLADTEHIMSIHRIWCDENAITHTPAVFINNHLYLSEYSFEDLKYFAQAAAKQHYAQEVSVA